MVFKLQVMKDCINYLSRELDTMIKAPILSLILITFGVSIGCLIAKWRYDKLVEILKEKQSNLDLQIKPIEIIDLNDYNLNKETGWFSHKERSGEFCPICLTNKNGGREIPLVVDKAGWDCPVCGEARITLKGPERFGAIYSP